MHERLYICEIDGCGNQVVIRSKLKDGEQKGKKVCGYCYQKFRSVYTQKREKKSKQTPKLGDKNDLKEYFAYHLQRAKRSEESDKPLNLGKSNICHLLPKRKYKSVRSDLENVVYLTIDEHSRFDHLLDCNDFEQIEKEYPNCWYDVCTRVVSVLSRTKEKGKLRTLWEEYLTERGFLI